MRLGVADQELAQGMRLPRPARADQHRAALLVFEQGDAAQDEGAHHDLAQFGVGHHQVMHGRLVDQEQFALFAYLAARHDAATGEQVDVAGEHAGAVRDHEFLAARAAAGNIERSRQQDEHADVAIALTEQCCAGGVATALAERQESGDLILRENREHLLAA